MCDEVILQEAQPQDARTLSRLAIRSKAYWGYSDEFMQACQEELTVTPEQICSDDFYFVIAKKMHKIVGFYSVEHLPSSQFELDALFVEPTQMGLGIGRTLMTHAKQYVSACGGKILIIQADPNAEAFYRAAGAQFMGQRESMSIPGRFLTVFRMEIADH